MCKYNYIALPSGCNHPTPYHNFTWKGICYTEMWNLAVHFPGMLQVHIKH